MALQRAWRRRRPVAPTFIVVGANKGGTTSLWRYLNQHPDVFMSRIKEPMFFSDVPEVIEGRPDGVFRSEVVRSWDDYLQLFERARHARAVGEASTSYLCDPSVPARIQARLPDVRLLAILRNPFDRAFSSYQMYQRLGMDELTFQESVEHELARLEGRVAARDEWRQHLHLGFYGRALKRYLGEFPRDQVGIYLYDDLEVEPTVLISGLYGFIGVDTSFRPNMSKRHNAAPIRQGALWDPSLRDRFLRFIEPDIAIVEQLVERDLSSWRRPSSLLVPGPCGDS